MRQIKFHRFSARNVTCLAAFMALLLLLSGCAVTPPKVDPYSTLLPAGRKLVDGATSISVAGFKQETAYLVVGANFVTYVDVWSKFQKMAEEGNGNLVYSKAFLLDNVAQWSPARATALVSSGLQRHFRNIVVVDDLAEARTRGAKWIVMFDHAFVQVSTLTATWENSTSIDLLDGNFRRVVASAVFERKDYGGAMNESDVYRFGVYRGEDVLRTVKSAQSQFDAKLAGLSR